MEELEKIGGTEQISIPIRFGQVTCKKPRFLKINVGSVEKKLYISKNATRLNEGIASKNKTYINADLTKIEQQQQKLLRDEIRLHKDNGEIELRKIIEQ